MSRNSGGTYTLPAGNPVTTGTTISSTWANTTLGDIATALTDSLSRSGQGSMTAPLQLTAGAIGAPALTWALETTAGFYRAGAADIRFALVGADVLKIGQHSLTAPAFIPTDSTVPANGMYLSAANTVAMASNSTLRWSVNSTGNQTFAAPTSGSTLIVNALGATYALDVRGASGNACYIGMLDGHGGAQQFDLGVGNLGSSEFSIRDATAGGLERLQITTAGVVSVSDAGTLREVGYRDLPFRVVSSNVATADTDAGKVVFCTAGITTLTLHSSSRVGTLITVINETGGNVTIALGGGTLTWDNGTGATGSGARTLANAGVATLWVGNGPATWRIWGNGIS